MFFLVLLPFLFLSRFSLWVGQKSQRAISRKFYETLAMPLKRKPNSLIMITIIILIIIKHIMIMIKVHLRLDALWWIMWLGFPEFAISLLLFFMPFFTTRKINYHTKHITYTPPSQTRNEEVKIVNVSSWLSGGWTRNFGRWETLAQNEFHWNSPLSNVKCFRHIVIAKLSQN